MALLLHCYEPTARPTRASLSLSPGDRFSVWALGDGRDEAAAGLRATVVRLADAPPPPGASLLLEAEVRPPRGAEGALFRARRLNPRIDVEILRPELRSRMLVNQEWRGGTRLEATLPDLSTLSFTLELASGQAAGARAGAAGRARRGEGSALGALLWLIPSAASTLADPKARLVAWLQARLKQAGISPALLSPMLVMLVLAAGLGTVALLQHQAAGAAEARALAAEEARSSAEASRDAALLAEGVCMESRRALAEALDDEQTRAKLQAEQVLAASLSRAVAVELGGPRMGTPEALAFDAAAAPRAVAQVVLEMAKLGGAASAERCLGLSELVGQDLPLYLLVWHPDPELVCSADYHVVSGGVDRAGAWGLSARAAAAFGAAEAPGAADGPAGDPRGNDRWSARALAAGFRAVQGALLGADTGARPPVAPGQAQLWTLALWDAYNRMPAAASGASEAPVEHCVAALLTEVAAARGPAAPGEPVLPDIVAVVRGESVTVSPTSRCPWPADALATGATAALRAVAQLGQLGLSEPEAP